MAEEALSGGGCEGLTREGYEPSANGGAVGRPSAPPWLSRGCARPLGR